MFGKQKKGYGHYLINEQKSLKTKLLENAASNRHFCHSQFSK